MSHIISLQPAQAQQQANIAPLQEVFSSVQGEGPHVGKPQIFVRFAHCHLKCAYCDTPMQTVSGQCQFYPQPGSNDFQLLPNPMTPDAVLGAISALLPLIPHHSVSFTGGEPLLYHRFLRELFPLVHALVPTYLETSGTQPDFLEPILAWTNIIAMDIKLPSATGEPPEFDNHSAFYGLARSNRQTEVFAKIIINDAYTQAELETVRGIVTDADCPIMLQPVTLPNSSQAVMSARRLFEAQQFLLRHYSDVRVIPQTHKMMNLL